jgi:hypothetical protein
MISAAFGRLEAGFSTQHHHGLTHIAKVASDYRHGSLSDAVTATDSFSPRLQDDASLYALQYFGKWLILENRKDL